MSADANKIDRETRPSVCGIVVTYNPDADISRRLLAMARESDALLVLDNGSCAETVARMRDLDPAIEVRPLGRNEGLAAALNHGLCEATSRGYQWAVTYDQDSTPAPGMVSALWTTIATHSEPHRIAVAGPRLREEKLENEDQRWLCRDPRHRWMFRRQPCEGRDLPDVTFVITSGAMMNLSIFERVGPMDEGLFIDYIDHDYCLKARRAGYEIIVSAHAWLWHNLGAKQEFLVAGKAVRPTFHSALRLRYMHRNRWRVLRRHALAEPHWAIFDIVFTSYNMLRVVLFESGRIAKVAAALQGTWDGLRGRAGAIVK